MATVSSTSSSSAQSNLGRVEVSSSPQARFEEYLQSKGQRNSEQRRLILEHVFCHHQHFDADQLIDQLPRKGNPGYVSRSTVYRTLTELEEAGLLRSFELDGRSVFEHDYGYPQHDHLYCSRCRKLFEFTSPDLIELRNRIAAEKGFRVTNHRLIINGICADCSKIRRPRRKQDLV